MYKLVRLFVFVVAPAMVAIVAPAPAATCYGEKDCDACRNCNYCRFCNSTSGTKCGVYYSSRGMPDPRDAKVVKHHHRSHHHRHRP